MPLPPLILLLLLHLLLLLPVLTLICRHATILHHDPNITLINREDMRAEFAAAAEQRKRAGEDEEGGEGAPGAKRSKAEQLGADVLEVLNEVGSVRLVGRLVGWLFGCWVGATSQGGGQTADGHVQTRR